MHYTIHFFAMNAEAVAARFPREADAIADQVVEKIKAQGDPTEQDLIYSRQFAQNLCTGNFSKEDAADEINTLCWMCEVVGEKVEIPDFHMFRSVDYLEDIGIWPLFQEEQPPFPVPISADFLPEVGYMSLEAIKDQTESEFGDLPECSDAQAEDARDELLGVLETLCDDKLDLLAILTGG